MASSSAATDYDANLAQESSISESDPVQAPAAQFECPICLGWLRDPMQTSCGHRFCRKCIQNWLEREKNCPVDNKPLDSENDIFPDNFIRREISQQRIKCPNVVRGCLKDLSPLDVESHLVNCKFGLPKLPDNEKLRCMFVGIGCDDKFEDEPEQQRHNEQHMQKHLLLLSQAHLKLIVNNSASSSTAAIAQQANFWDPPSKSDQNPAIQTNVVSNDSIQPLLRSLYEKIVVLEQKNREQEIIIANMSDQIATSNLAMSKLPLRYCNGCYLWHVSDFKNRVNQMRNNHHIMHYSPGFYTSPHGYKLCIRFNLSPKDPSYVAILIHMMKTDHDNSLDWPFSGRISVTLVHPVESFYNIKETMMTRPELEAFKRPVQDLNPRGFGYTEFALIEDLDTQGFIDNNQLAIRVHAQPV